MARILRPLARALIGRRATFPAASTALKRAYLGAAMRDYRLDGKMPTDSRLHLLTGLQRKDIKTLRAVAGIDPSTGTGPLPRVISAWLTDHAGPDGPLPLPRTGGAPSFEALVATISRDIHPRTVLDELVRLEQVRLEGDEVHLLGDAFVPRADETALISYFGANLGDHAEAAAANLAAAPAPGPFYERAVHYNHLTPEAVAELDALAREKLTGVLKILNARAQTLQRRDRAQASATHRFRTGAYMFSADENGTAGGSEAETPSAARDEAEGLR